MDNHQSHSAHGQQQSHQQHSTQISGSGGGSSSHSTQQQSQKGSQNHSSGSPHLSQSRSSKTARLDNLPFEPDQWVCVLCRKICHYRGLGDLYGPYNIDFSTSSTCSDGNIEKSNKPSITPKKSKYSLLNHNYAVKEVWIHEDCLIWSEGVHLIGKKILKMDETIKASFNHNCSICKVKGATIGCAGKRCRRKFHYNCGRDGNCLLDEANFTLKCDKCLANTAANLSFSINR